jgi:hypothetical protein
MVSLNMMGSSTSLTACSTGASMTANTLQTTVRSPSDPAVGVALRMANQYPNGSDGTLPSPNARQRKRAARYQYN